MTTSPRDPLRFIVPSIPVPMARPRVAVRGGRPHAYVPAKTQQAAWEIRQSATAALSDHPPFAGPVALHVVVFVPVPKSLPKKLLGVARPTKRPDLDNYLKTAFDGCSVLWGDDSQVVELRALKRYAFDRPPRWEVEVREA